MLLILTASIFFLCLIAESITSWIFIKVSKKRHPVLWEHAEHPTLMGNGDLMSAYPLIRYLWTRSYSEVPDRGAVAFAEKLRLPTTLSYAAAWLSIIPMLIALYTFPQN